MANITVVDDDPGIRMLLDVKLRGAGHQVISEEDGEGGLAAIRSSAPDLIVLDWMLPRMTGLEVCIALRHEPEYARTPIVLLTSKAQENDVVRGLRAGADDYVVKPFSPVELLGRIDRLLGRQG